MRDFLIYLSINNSSNDGLLIGWKDLSVSGKIKNITWDYLQFILRQDRFPPSTHVYIYNMYCWLLRKRRLTLCSKAP